MINQISNQNIFAVVMATTLLLTLIPVSASAQPNGGRADAGDFCENIDDNEDNAIARIAERKEAADKRDEAEGQKEERMKKLDQTRADRDAARESRYSDLRDKATTDEQTVAVQEFAETVDALVSERRAAVDAAIEDFEEAVEELLEERDAALDKYANGLEGDVADIYKEASESCDDGDSSASVRATFMEDMKALREASKADRGTYAFKEELDAARADRRAAVEGATTEFQERLEDAKDELRSAFGFTS